MRTTALNRRIFLKGSIVGGLAAATSLRLSGLAAAAKAVAPRRQRPRRADGRRRPGCQHLSQPRTVP